MLSVIFSIIYLFLWFFYDDMSMKVAKTDEKITGFYLTYENISAVNYQDLPSEAQCFY